MKTHDKATLLVAFLFAIVLAMMLDWAHPADAAGTVYVSGTLTASAPQTFTPTPAVLLQPHYPPEFGTASWYGVPYHGRRAADGSVFNMYEMTAAHRTLRLGTVVQVTNLRNGLAVVVRITDRGPFADEARRVIDLSMAAARVLGMEQSGLAHVRVDVISVPMKAKRTKARA